MTVFRESVLKSFYREWLRAPVDHSHESFVRVCVNKFGWSEQAVENRLKNKDWYKQR